jgi:hypothetical protein
MRILKLCVAVVGALLSSVSWAGEEIRRSIHNTGETLPAKGVEVGTFGAYFGATDNVMFGVLPNFVYGQGEALSDRVI